MRSSARSARCARSSSPTPSWRATAGRSTERILAILFVVLALPALLEAAELTPASARDRRVLKTWSLSGEPRGIAVGRDGTIYAGLSGPQSLVAIDPEKGAILAERILDREEIASTKDFVSLRLDPKRARLVIAQGSDESVTIVGLPDLVVEREIGLEGETIRDALPDPLGRYLFVLGREVHVYDADGNRRIRGFSDIEPTAIAASSDGSLLAIAGFEQFESGRAAVVSLVEIATLEELRRDPLQTDRTVRSVLFAPGNRALIIFADDWMAEKPLAAPTSHGMARGARGVEMRIGAENLLSSRTICLPAGTAAQVAATAGKTVVYAERRCSAGGSLDAAPRTVQTASLFGVDALAVAYDSKGGRIAVVDRGGSLTLYSVPPPDEK